MERKKRRAECETETDTKYAIINKTDHFFCYTTPPLSLTMATHKEVNQPSGYSAFTLRSNLAEIHKMTKLFSTKVYQLINPLCTVTDMECFQNLCTIFMENISRI